MKPDFPRKLRMKPLPAGQTWANASRVQGVSELSDLSELQRSLTQRLGGYLVPTFDRFVQALAADETTAALLTTPLRRLDGQMVMPIDDIQRHAGMASRMQCLLGHERQLAHVAALVQPLGQFLLIRHAQWKLGHCVNSSLAMYEVMLALDREVAQLSSVQWSPELKGLSTNLVATALHGMRRKSPRTASILLSVWSGQLEEGVDPAQITRISAAITLSHVRLMSLWRDRGSSDASSEVRGRSR